MNANSLPSFKASTHLMRTATVFLSLAMMSALAVVATPAAQAQTYTVIHAFTGGADGQNPWEGLTMDGEGNFFGTTFGRSTGYSCNTLGCGTVFKLSRAGAGWTLNTLYRFGGFNGNAVGDGSNPWGRVFIAEDGTLYGTTYYGGTAQTCAYFYWNDGCGTVYHLTAPAAPQAALWNETIIHRFTGGSDGGLPQGDLIFDQAGNIYGTAQVGGDNLTGVVYELTPSQHGWAETVIYAPSYPGYEGTMPSGGVSFDQAGNLYGALQGGGIECNLPYYCGGIFEVSPSGSGWSGKTIYLFTKDYGSNPVGGLLVDAAGNLYGTTPGGVSGGGGTVFELSPGNENWTIDTLYSFQSSDYYGGPQNKLVMDAAGNLYGTTFRQGTHDLGTVFKLAPSSRGWQYTLLHDFTGGSDGAWPRTNLVFDAEGNLYGTAAGGGTGGACDNGCGVIFEITP